MEGKQVESAAVVLKETFNTGNGEVAGQPEMGAKPLNPYASHVHLSGLSAIQLAGLELAGVILPRLTGGIAGIVGPDGRRQKGDSVAAQETAILEAMNATAQARQKWDAQLVNVGGTMMTNAEIQLALRRIIDNPDQYAQYAVAEGLIEEGQEQAFVDAATQYHDLREKQGNGDLSASDQEALDALQESALGKAVMEAVPVSHADWASSAHASADQLGSVAGTQADAAQRATLVEGFVGAGVDDQPFGHVPPLTPAFAAGLAALEPLDRPDTRPNIDQRPAEPDPALAASGFDF